MTENPYTGGKVRVSFVEEMRVHPIREEHENISYIQDSDIKRD